MLNGKGRDDKVFLQRASGPASFAVGIYQIIGDDLHVPVGYAAEGLLFHLPDRVPPELGVFLPIGSFKGVALGAPLMKEGLGFQILVIGDPLRRSQEQKDKSQQAAHSAHPLHDSPPPHLDISFFFIGLV
jgi:hypothetical protein